MSTNRIARPSVLAAATLVILAACGSGTNSDVIGPGTETPPPPSAYVYTAVFTLDSIRISTFEACDGRDIFGNAVPGAFHYKVVASAKNSDTQVASSGYGSVLGVALSRGPRAIISLGARKITFGNLHALDRLDLKFSMIEWDGPIMDGVLRGLVVSASDNPGSRGIDFLNSNDLTTGIPSTCGGTLFYQLRITGKLA